MGEEPEVISNVTTKDGFAETIKTILQPHVTQTNFADGIAPTDVNQWLAGGLNREISRHSPQIVP